MNRTQTYLIMSHDSNEAILSLVDDKPYLQFLGVGRTTHVKKLSQILAAATNTIRGTMINSPFYSGEYCWTNCEIYDEKLILLSSVRKRRGNHGTSVGRNHNGVRRYRQHRRYEPPWPVVYRQRRRNA